MLMPGGVWHKQCAHGWKGVGPLLQLHDHQNQHSHRHTPNAAKSLVSSIRLLVCAVLGLIAHVHCCHSTQGYALQRVEFWST
jgi:hypothetical protein